MIPLLEPELGERERLNLERCIRDNVASTIGPFVAQFEDGVARACEARGAVATSAGTTALHLALRAVGVGPGDLVILPSYTFVATANAVAHCGALPWLFDCDAGSLTLDAERLADEITRCTELRGDAVFHATSGRRVAAILPVYTFGLPADMDRLRLIARRHRLPLVADAACALGARHRGEPIGELADLSVFSFNGNKTVTCGGGGAVVGDPSLLQRIRHLSSQAKVGPGYEHDEVGFNYRMTNLQAAVGCAQLERLDALVAAKRRIRARYDEAFASDDRLQPLPSANWAESACWLSGVVLAEGSGLDAGPLCEDLQRRGIAAGRFWKPMHLQIPYGDCPRADLQTTDRLWGRVVALPSSSSLDEAAQQTVIDAVRSALGAPAD